MSDPFDVLTALRPATVPDDDWAAAELARITVGTTPAARRRPTGRRVVVSTVVAGALLAGGVGTAAATGVLPDRLAALLGPIARETGTDPATVVRAATAPGPDGRVFTVLTWSGAADGTVCSAPLFETPASAAGPAPTDFAENGGMCEPRPNSGPFGADAGINWNDRYAVYEVSAGAAVRGELRLPDGSTHPAVLVRGWLYGWFPAGSAGELTGYAADGSVVGTVPVQARN